MKKALFLLLLITMGIIACVKDSNIKKSNKKLTDIEASESFDIVAQSGLREYLSVSPNTTWQDLDVFYLRSIEKYHDRPDLDNFKCAAIIFMVNIYNILDDQSDRATDRIEYYTQEMASLNNCNPEILYAMLLRLRERWDALKIAQTASIGYNNAMRVTQLLIRNNSSNTSRTKGMEDLKSLFETRD